jgi:hypothetical protein
MSSHHGAALQTERGRLRFPANQPSQNFAFLVVILAGDLLFANTPQISAQTTEN